ncbi:MAG: DUF523 and DUF1722 domain-containing protein [Candidatus Brocadiaceae bacterium]|nr:DUF523 and DUF1722 domain-containing protein [Candidatus Brocadiaceae bacterium]
MTKKIKLGISSCLLGEKVRYGGGHKRDRFITNTLGQYFDWVPVCPEMACGLPVPREPMRLVRKPESPHLVTIKTGIDYTDKMEHWTKKELETLEKEPLCGFIFKAKSPSSGIGGIKVYLPSGEVTKTGSDIFGGAFMKHFPLIPVIDDGRLHNPVFRENFIERVFVFRRWHDFIQSNGTFNGLVDFHTRHKLLIMSHNPRHYSILGRWVAHTKGKKQETIFSEYIRDLMECLRLTATTKKNTNVLQHIQGYFKKRLTSEEKQELLDIITHYHNGLIPLIVPVTLVRHYVRKFDISYLKKQYYLDPHPLELMLRNHV